MAILTPFGPKSPKMDEIKAGAIKTPEWELINHLVRPLWSLGLKLGHCWLKIGDNLPKPVFAPPACPYKQSFCGHHELWTKFPVPTSLATPAVYCAVRQYADST